MSQEKQNKRNGNGHNQQIEPDLEVRVGEALQLYVEDLDMTLDDEHIYVRGKGGKRRTVLLDDFKLVAQLRCLLLY